MGARRGYVGLFGCLALLVLGSGCAASRLWEPSREQVLQRILPPSVQIVLEREGRRFRSGSGVVIGIRPAPQGSDCFVLASGHTFGRLTGGEEIYVRFGRHVGSGTRARASLLAHRETDDLDIALLRVQSDQCVAARPARPPALGEPVWVVAYPWGRNMTLVGGIVSQVNPEDPTDRETASRFMVDASVSYGASGGGVFEARTGRLVGLVEGYRTARVSFRMDAYPGHIDVPVPGETYVTSLADIRRFLAETGYAELWGGTPRAGPSGSKAHRSQ